MKKMGSSTLSPYIVWLLFLTLLLASFGCLRFISGVEAAANTSFFVPAMWPDDAVAQARNEKLFKSKVWIERFLDLSSRIEAKTWKDPPPASKFVGSDTDKIWHSAALPESRIGQITIRLESEAILRYVAGSAKSLNLYLKGIGSDLLEPDYGKWSGDIKSGSLQISEVDSAPRYQQMRFSIESSCATCEPTWLTEPVTVPVELFSPGREVIIHAKLDALLSNRVREGEPAPSLPVKMTYQLYDPERTSGDDRNADSPKQVFSLPDQIEPFSDSLSFPAGDATDHLSLGGDARFSIALIVADGDLRTVLRATRSDSVLPIGRFSGDGRMFAAAVDDWQKIQLQLRSSASVPRCRYFVYLVSNNTYPARSIILWFAGSYLGLPRDVVKYSKSNLSQVLAFIAYVYDADFVPLDFEAAPNPHLRRMLLRLSDVMSSKLH